MADANAWELVKQGRFVEACEVADHDYVKTGQAHHLGNKIFALLNMARFDEASNICARLSGGKLIMAGVIFWLMDKPADAIKAWRAERGAKFTDAAGGLTSPMFLLYAATSLNDESLRIESVSTIMEILRYRTASNWPGPLGSYAVGRSTEDEVLVHLSHQPILRDRQLCAANFHFGVNCLKIDRARFIRQMSLAIQGSPAIMLEPQYYLAKGELVREGLAKWAA